MLSKNWKIFLAPVLFFMATMYFIMIFVKSYETVNSTVEFIAYLFSGGLVGSIIGGSFLYSCKEQQIPANRWLAVKLERHYSRYFLLYL